MKFKVLFLLIIINLICFKVNAQRVNGARIGYIDTQYILDNVPEYKEASSLLNKKVLQWKSEVEKRLSEIEQKKQELDNEKVLLTKELYDERAEDLAFEEAQVIDYQQKRFGPNGDLMLQKRQLIEPIQDQIFAAVQDIAELKRFDFVFDKSADVVMLYSAKRYDISEQVLKTITRTSKRKQAKNKKERKALEDENVIPTVDNDKEERQKALDDKKAAREAQLAERKAQREQAAAERKKQQEELRETKRREAAERRQKRLDAIKKASEASKTKIEAETPEKDVEASETAHKTSKDSVKTDRTTIKAPIKKDSIALKKPKTAAEILEERRRKKIEERKRRQQKIEERKRISDSIAKAKNN